MADATHARTTGDPIDIPAGAALLHGELTVPKGARGVILFAHSGESGRSSPGNRAVAAALQSAGFATLLLDLSTATEEREAVSTGRHRFDLALLAHRLTAATDWLTHDPRTRLLAIGYFGASTGAAAALLAAARRPDRVHAIVSQGGRPDLAGVALREVGAPTLLIVGAQDLEVLRLNRLAQRDLHGEHDLIAIPGATRRFEEHGALDAVSAAAADWFARHLPGILPGVGPEETW